MPPNNDPKALIERIKSPPLGEEVVFDAECDLEETLELEVQSDADATNQS